MNPYGSYKALRGNAIAAMMSSIEIYNKPRLSYRSECFVMLLVNSWELILKAILSKKKERIFYPKERNMPYRSLDLYDAMSRCKSFFPSSIPYVAVSSNIERLVEFRNNAVHFYNEPNFEVLIYGLAQTSIVNFRDLVLSVFGLDIADEVNICLLPLAFGPPPDPIHFIKSDKEDRSQSVSEYIKIISETTEELERDSVDTGRFLTVYNVSLQSTKKITSADVIAGVQSGGVASGTILNRRIDPNKTHPLLQKHILDKIGATLKGLKFNQYSFQAIVWANDIKNKERFYWRDDAVNTSRYSNDIVAWLNQLSKSQIEDCIRRYKEHCRGQQNSKK